VVVQHQQLDSLLIGIKSSHNGIPDQNGGTWYLVGMEALGIKSSLETEDRSREAEIVIRG
jgi:hypothetical protein